MGFLTIFFTFNSISFMGFLTNFFTFNVISLTLNLDYSNNSHQYPINQSIFDHFGYNIYHINKKTPNYSIYLEIERDEIE